MLVTGASGFIGTRLIRRLILDRRDPVTALVHRLGTVGTARLATLPGVRLVAGDVRDRSVVDDAMRGCDVVVHCAADPSSAPSVQEEVTTRGTRTVLEAARRHHVRHLIFLSTAAVHSWTASGRWNEDAPVQASDFYARSKLTAESLLFGNADVPVTVVRPTCVYGPFGRTFTIAPVEMLRLGIPLVSTGDAGRANLIYVDNLVDLVVGTVDRRPDVHRVYLATEDAPSDWETLYSAYARTVNVPMLQYAATDSWWQVLREEVSVSASNGRLLFGRTADLRGPLLRGLASYHRHVPLLQRFDRFIPSGKLRKAAAAARRSSRRENVAAAAAGGGERILPFTPRALREFYDSKAVFSADRAKLELGWVPRVSATEAIDRTCAWIKFAGL